jgi:hypothetical protein
MTVRTSLEDIDPLTSLPTPSRDARWRWSTPRRAMVGGTALAGVLGLGVTSAGAATTHTSSTSSTSSTSTTHQGRPSGTMTKPTAAGKVTALSGRSITISTGRSSTDVSATTVSYTASTVLRTRSGTTTSSSLKVGDFISVQGTTNPDGTVAASSIMISTSPPGMGKGNGGPAKSGPGGKKGNHAPPKDGSAPSGTAR